jgi:hypothetical protein
MILSASAFLQYRMWNLICPQKNPSFPLAKNVAANAALPALMMALFIFFFLFFPSYWGIQGLYILRFAQC